MRLARFEGSKSFHIFLSVAFFIAHGLSRLGTSLKIEDGVAGTHSASTLRTSLSSSMRMISSSHEYCSANEERKNGVVPYCMFPTSHKRINAVKLSACLSKFHKFLLTVDLPKNRPQKQAQTSLFRQLENRNH